jgi:glycosyltransferase involved in cell wall biosynthesis
MASTTVDVIMSVYKPNVEYLRTQIRSILAQTHTNLRLILVSDGNPPPWEKIFAGIDDPRIYHFDEPDNLGVLRGFTRALRVATTLPGKAPDFFAFSDQDDIWHPEKIQKQLKVLRFTGKALCHCDARLVDASGATIGETMFGTIDPELRGTLPALMLGNSVTGMTILCDAALRSALLNPPPLAHIGQHDLFHDWWAALVASAGNGIAFIAEPLVDYRQHGLNVMGVAHRTQGERWPDLRPSRLRTVTKGTCRAFADRRTVARHLLTLDGGQLVNLSPAGRKFLRRRFNSAADAGLGFLADAFRFHVRGDGVSRGMSLRLACGKLGTVLNDLKGDSPIDRNGAAKELPFHLGGGIERQ